MMRQLFDVVNHTVQVPLRVHLRVRSFPIAFLERIFYPCEHKIEGRPWALFVSAGQDGSGAITSVERIVTGLRLKKIREPILALREVTPAILEQCEELGATLAVGIATGAL
jgi:hypothetical protein